MKHFKSLLCRKVCCTYTVCRWSINVSLIEEYHLMVATFKKDFPVATSKGVVLPTTSNRIGCHASSKLVPRFFYFSVLFSFSRKCKVWCGSSPLIRSFMCLYAGWLYLLRVCTSHTSQHCNTSRNNNRKYYNRSH